MDKKTEALKLALEALDCIYSPLHVREINKVGAAMSAIREALADHIVDVNKMVEQPAQQQGWKLVPVQPTDEMRDAGNAIIGDRGALFAAYRAMLNAAPQPAQQQEPVAKVIGTAPERIWLDVGFDPEAEDEVSFDYLSEVTWSRDNASGFGIEYVRADLSPASKPLTNEQIEREWQFLHDEEGNPPDHYDFARAIEAAHGIKGEAK